ncbi:hypothetical protein G9A89_006314 [Geosiphon pyriformis]|nr:hypothetical protein G9A89_006314 [Geosiphon pyriformis]
MTLHHLELYGLKSFKQVLTESLMANLVNFSNTGGTLGSFLNCFLAGAMHALASCNTSLGGILSNVFRAGSGVPILNMLGMCSYLSMRNSLRKYCLIFANQLLDCHGFVSVSDFIKNGGLSNNMVMASHSASADVVCDIGLVFKRLLAIEHGSIDVYMDSSVKSLGSIGVYSGAAAYFPKANVSIGVKVLGLLSSMLVELQAIALALNVENRPVFGNTCHFVKNLFEAVNFVNWESKFGANIVDVSFAEDVNSFKFFSVWHPDGGICSGYTSLFSAALWSYFMKSLYYCLLVTMRKRLYDPKYPSVVCIRCGVVKNSDHLFLCKHDKVARLNILSNIGVK